MQTKVMAEDITATSKAGVLCPCQCTHWTEHCFCSVLQHHFHFFWKITYWFYFLPRKKKILSTVKWLPENRMITFVLLYLLNVIIFFALCKLVASESYQKLAYLNLQLCKLENFKMLQYLNAFLGSLFKINFAKCVLFI